LESYLIDNVKEHCFGCRACEQICPQKCIDMIEDNEGFFYPKINVNICIKCGLCRKACPINKNNMFSLLNQPIVYAAWNKNNEILRNSSSGGMFSAIADYVLNKKGTVFGCAFDNKFIAKHICTEDKKNMYKIRGSKYVQSDTSDTYKQVKKLLNKGKYVFYTGTPCQIAALKSFIGQDYKNLITADLICNGVPSQKIFTQYIKHLENIYKGKITEFRFRDKLRYGWTHSYYIKINKDNYNKSKCKTAYLSSYYYAFLNKMIQRPSCYGCPYSNTKREGDITIADFWGIEKFYPQIDTSMGMSLVIINTYKGLDIINALDNKIEKIEMTMNQAKYQQENLKHPIFKPELRNIIYKEIDKLGFDKAAKMYFVPKHIILVKLKSIIPREVKWKIKKILKYKNINYTS
jgi:coenzyme F420-reducing hydrogenase beta subunit